MTGPGKGYTPADWAGDSAQRWAAQADRLEAQLAPVSNVLFGAAALQPGERVLDIGCGRGATTCDAAVSIGASATAVGVDVSEALVQEARDLAVEHANVEFVVADAQHHEFGAATVDVVISRFGVMFFEDPVAAFANIRSAVRPGGRLVAAVWQIREQSDIMNVPLRLGVEVINTHGHEVELPASDGGPFSLGDPVHATEVLQAAGWSGVVVTPHRLDLYNGGPGTVDDALEVAFTIGPLRMLLADLPDAVSVAAHERLHEEFTARHDGVGVRFEGAINVISAIAP